MFNSYNRDSVPAPINRDWFRFWRIKGASVAEAARTSRGRIDKPHAATPRDALASYQNKPGERGGRWIESPEAAGLRFVGWSDELRDYGRDSHSGWFLYPEGDPAEVARGCVYQLPARDGRPIYVEAIRTGETLGRRGEWRDMGEEGGALIFLAERHAGERGGTEGDTESAARDAAHGADSEARIYAEREREYNEAFAAGGLCAEKEADAKAERESARELVRELRTFYRSGFKLPPAACATIRAGLRAHIRDASKAASKARELRDEWATLSGWRSHLADAFAEGLGA